MRDFQERREMKRIMFSLPAVLLVVFLAALAFYGVLRAYSARLEIKREIAELTKQIKKSDKVANNFQEKFSKLNTSQGLEKEARGRFNLKMPGEEVVIFLDDDFGAISANSFGARFLSFWGTLKKFLVSND